MTRIKVGDMIANGIECMCIHYEKRAHAFLITVRMSTHFRTKSTQFYWPGDETPLSIHKYAIPEFKKYPLPEDDDNWYGIERTGTYYNIVKSMTYYVAEVTKESYLNGRVYMKPVMGPGLPMSKYYPLTSKGEIDTKIGKTFPANAFYGEVLDIQITTTDGEVVSCNSIIIECHSVTYVEFFLDPADDSYEHRDKIDNKSLFRAKILTEQGYLAWVPLYIFTN